MGKIKDLLDNKNPLQLPIKPLKVIKDRSSVDGKIKHDHEIVRDENGVPTGHGPASKGPQHKHPIDDLGDGKYKLGPAEKTDPEDPNHSHDISDQSEAIHKKKKKKKIKKYG